MFSGCLFRSPSAGRERLGRASRRDGLLPSFALRFRRPDYSRDYEPATYKGVSGSHRHRFRSITAGMTLRFEDGDACDVDLTDYH